MAAVKSLFVFGILNLVILSLEANSGELNFLPICATSHGTFSIAQSASFVANIKEGDNFTVFMNWAPEYVFECKSHNEITEIVDVPEIKFVPFHERYKYNRFREDSCKDLHEKCKYGDCDLQEVSTKCPRKCGKCTREPGCMHDNTDYYGNDLVNYRDTEVTGTWEGCSELCRAEPKCKYWTWFKDNYPEAILRGKCLIKAAKGNVQDVDWGVSGSRNCGAGGTSYPGEYTGILRQNLSSNLLENDRSNHYNKRAQSISCVIRNETVCKLNLIVLNDEPVANCNVSSPNHALNNSSGDNRKHIHGSRADALDCQISEIPQLRSSSRFQPILRYSVLDKSKDDWVLCDKVGKDDEVLDPKNALNDHLEKIRCPFDFSEKKPLLIRVTTELRTGITAGLPIFYPTNKTFSYFTVYLNDTIFRDNDPPRVPKHPKESENTILVAVLTSVVTITIVVVFIISITRCKQFYKRRGPTQDEIENLENIKVEGYNETALNESKNKTELKNDTIGIPTTAHPATYCTACSGYSDTSSMLTDETSVTYCKAHRYAALDEIDEKYLDLKTDEKVEFRKTILARQLSGDPTKINPTIALNEQARVMVYNPKLEIDRSNFSVGQMLGSGNFGCVYKGEAMGLFYADSRTQVAVKTVNDPLDGPQRTALLCEMKILSNLELHLNLVNMMGSCTSDFAVSGELWLLLEFCEHGDMKSFLIKNEAEILSNMNGSYNTGDLGSRLLIQWAYDIAKGMQYLARMHIMHGDLASRNILIGKGQGSNGSTQLVAKVSDFGLSKTFYDNIRYKKQKRQYVPWKWMALEYLQTGCLTITSDVWSYGIVIYEIFSLGKEPYIGKRLEDMIGRLKEGYHLPCPEEVKHAATWDPKGIYDKLAKACFVAEPMKRATFSDIVQILEDELYEEEKAEYSELTKQYASMRDLMEDPVTQLKRSSTFNRSSLQLLNQPSPKTKRNGGSLIPDDGAKNNVSSYLKAVSTIDDVDCIQKLNQDSFNSIQSNGDIRDNDNMIHISEQNTPKSTNTGYITLSQNENAVGLNVQANINQSGYVAFEDVMCGDKITGNDNELRPVRTPEKMSSERHSPVSGNLCVGYVSMETANICTSFSEPAAFEKA